MSVLEHLGMHAGAKPEIFIFARKLHATMTPEEKILWEFLRLKPQGFNSRRQHPFCRYILDFYCRKTRLSIELDGKYHNLPEQKTRHNIRTEVIQEFGVKEIRFTNEEVNEDIEAVKMCILSLLDKVVKPITRLPSRSATPESQHRNTKPIV